MIESILLCALLAPLPVIQEASNSAPDLVVHVGKILTMDPENRVVNRGYLFIKDGKIQAISETDDAPADVTRIERPKLWAFPGMVDLHCHIATEGFSRDINDMHFPINHDLRVNSAMAAH